MIDRSARLGATQHAESYTDNIQLRSRKEHTQGDIDDSEEESEEGSEEDFDPNLVAPLRRDLKALGGDESALNQPTQSRSKWLPASMSQSPLLRSSSGQDASAYASVPDQGEDAGLSQARARGKRVRRHRASLESSLASGLGDSARQGSAICPLLDNDSGDEEAVIDLDSENAEYSGEEPSDNSPLVAFSSLV